MRFLGYRRDLRAIAEASDFYALSSDSEGTPVSLIEGAAAGRPAAATAGGGVAEVVTPDSGVLVDPGDHHALGRALSTLAADGPLRRRLGAEARRHALAQYSADRLIATMDELYTALIRDRAAGVSHA